MFKDALRFSKPQKCRKHGDTRMADKGPQSRKKARIKKTETIREKAQKNAESPKKQPRRIRQVTSKVGQTSRKVSGTAKKEYYLPLPEGKAGTWLNKRRSLVPQFLKNSWIELRQVVWPNRSETFKLTLAVLLFAVFFGSLIAGVDFVLDKLFREVILNV